MKKLKDELARWTKKVNPSPTANLEALIEKRRREGTPIFRLGLGQPDFPTPERGKNAAIQAIQDNFTGYTETRGILPLREAICRSLQRDAGLAYEPDEIVVSVGGKHALFNAIFTLCEPGDEVLIPIPYWVSFPEQVKLAGAQPVYIPTESNNGYKATPELLSSYVNESTRLLILNSPNNPSGAVYGREELERLAAFCIAHDLWVISDEVYSSFVYTPDGHHSIAAFPGMKERTVIVNAVSKSYSMTGWRIGYTAAPLTLSQDMAKLQSHVTSNPSSISQAAALAVVEGPQEEFESIRETYRQRRDFLVDAIGRLGGCKPMVPDGAFYIWVDVSDWAGKTLHGRVVSNADDLAELLLEEAKVAIAPGAGFGDPNCIRLSFATSQEELEAGIAALQKLLGSK